MKNTAIALSLTLLSLFTLNAAAAAESCADKRAAIEKEISYAREHNNTFKLAGLQKALNEVSAHCSADSLRNDAQQAVVKAQKKLADKRHDLQEAEQDLNQAIARDNKNKIAKYQQKVAEKKQDIEQLTHQLSQAQRDLTSLK